MTADDPRFTEWLERKPSAAKRKVNKLFTTPAAFLGAEVGKHVSSRVARQINPTIRRTLTAAGELGAATLGAAAASAAILAAGYVVMNHVAKNEQVKLGDRINAISNEFVNVQRQVQAKYGVNSWGAVPADVRNRALADYKRALGTATAQGQGSAFVGVRESYK